MSLLKFFKPSNSNLPQPEGCLATVMPSSSIMAANREVKKVLNEPAESTTRRGTYEYFTSEEKALIGKRAAEFGIRASIHYFSKKFPGRSLKESSVRMWMIKYRREIAARKLAGEDTTVKELGKKKIGRPLMLGEDLDRQVCTYLRAVRENGAVFNTAIAIACAKKVQLYIRTSPF